MEGDADARARKARGRRRRAAVCIAATASVHYTAHLEVKPGRRAHCFYYYKRADVLVSARDREHRPAGDAEVRRCSMCGIQS
jgi:hypothetical protein